MGVREVVEAEVLRLLEAPSRREAFSPMAPAAPPAASIKLSQRGRTGTAAGYNPELHPRGQHGMFAVSGRAKAKAASGSLGEANKNEAAAQRAAKKLEGERASKASKSAAAKARKERKEKGEPETSKERAERKARGERTEGSRSSRSTRSRGEARANAAYSAQQAVAKAGSGNAWQGKIEPGESLQRGLGEGKHEVANPSVALLQSKLTALGYAAGETNGQFGHETEAAVRLLQREYGLRPTGVVGPQTLQLLETLTQRSMQWQKQGIIESDRVAGESIAAYARGVAAVVTRGL